MDEATRKEYATEAARKAGKALAAQLTPEQRKAKATAAAHARWAKRKAETTKGDAKKA